MPRTIAARTPGPQHTVYLGPVIVQPPFPAAGIVVGKLPAFSIPKGGAMMTSVAFTGGTPAGTVGTTASNAAIIAALAPAGVGSAVSAIVAGFAPVVDTEVRLFITGGATAGVARFALEYIPPFV